MEQVIFYFFTFLVEAIILLQYASRLFKPKTSLQYRLIMLSILYIILFLVSLVNIKGLNMGLYLLANFLFLATQYILPYRPAIFHSAILAAVMGMCELVVYSIVEHFTPNFFAQVEYIHHTIIFIIISKILFFAIMYTLTYFFKSSQKQNSEYDSSVLLLIFIPITTVFVMLTFVTISDICLLTSGLHWMISISAVFLLATNLLVFAINQYNQRKNQDYTEMQLLLQKESDYIEYYKMLLTQSENQSILVHDIKKHLQSIDLLNKQGSTEKIDSYIQQLLLSSDLQEISRICDHELMNAILSRYARQCRDKNITFLTDIRSGTISFLDDNDITSLFCNLLENAIEATNNIENPYIEINTNKRENTPFVVITVVNSCRTTPFLPQSNQLITAKPDKQKHGFGIKSIRKIVKKHHGDIQMYYNEDTLTFHTIITLRTN